MLKSNKIYLKLITRNENRHAKCESVVAAFYYDFVNKTKHYLNFNHKDVAVDCKFDDFIKSINDQNIKVYVNDKKKYKYWLNCEIIDVNIFGFVAKNEVIDEVSNFCKDHLRSNHRNLNDFNLIVPYVIHQESFDKEVEEIKNLDVLETDSYCFKFFNNVITDTLFEVEKNGLKIKEETFSNHFKAKTYDGYVYSNYHIYNPTGRPSNAYDNINYVALKKDDGSRASFVSRFTNGHLMMIDFTGFHPYIVANLIKYQVPDNETIYEHLAKYYYNTDVITTELMSKAKKLTMVNLYGQISDQYINIEYFKKTEQLKTAYWTKFERDGYVTTPIYKRKITTNHISDPNKNKLFAYIIQAAETEYGMDRLQACLKFTVGKEILPILYNYDAILFDVGSIDPNDITDLIEIIKNKRFKVKVYKGNNYNDLKLVQL